MRQPTLSILLPSVLKCQWLPFFCVVYGLVAEDLTNRNLEVAGRLFLFRFLFSPPLSPRNSKGVQKRAERATRAGAEEPCAPL